MIFTLGKISTIRRVSLAILVALTLAQAQELSAKTVYTATNGNDSGSGAITSPYRTIVKCLSVMTAGDECIIRGGTYSEVFSGVYGAPGTPIGNSFSNAITIKAYPGERVTWTYTGGDAIFGLATDSYPTHRSFYYILEDLVFDGAGRTQFVIGGLNADYVRFKNVEVKNAISVGMLVGESNFSEYLNVQSHDNGSHGIYIQGANNLVDGGSYHNNCKYGVHVYLSGGSAVDRNVIRNTRIFQNGLTDGVGCGGVSGGIGGLILTSGTDNIAYNNLIYGNHGYGASISESGGSSSNKLYNNALYGNTSAILVGSGASSAEVKNNIVYSNWDNGVRDLGYRSSVISNYTSNPQFIDEAGADFRVRSSSATINAGVDLSATFTNDMMGTPRPLGGAFDIGPYEYVGSSASSLTPPTNLHIQ